MTAYGSINESIKKKDAHPHQRDVSSLWNDIFQLKEGTIPQSIVVSIVVSILCGVGCFIWCSTLEFMIEFFWKTLPEKYVEGIWPESCYFLWMALVGYGMALCLGLTVLVMGEPGDLAYTINCVHTKAYIALDHVPPMAIAALFSVAGGSSVGPEAALVAVCAALGGFVSRFIFKQTNRNVIRKHTLMGMCGSLSALFGCPLGGSLFALEINSRFGVEYFEHMIEAIFCGMLTLAVFRSLNGETIGPMYEFPGGNFPPASVSSIFVGGAIGLFGALIAVIFIQGHFRLLATFERFELMDNKYAIRRAMLGATGFIAIGMFVPHTFFWGEEQLQVIATGGLNSELPQVWPTSGIIDFQNDNRWKAFLVGFFKLVAVSFSVAGGFRGGFIFPFFAAGAAFGRFLVYFFPSLDLSMAALCVGAGINVAITKTSLSTPIILMKVSGQDNMLPPLLAASLVSLFATSYMPFIKAQVARDNIVESIWYAQDDDDGLESMPEDEEYIPTPTTKRISVRKSTIPSSRRISMNQLGKGTRAGTNNRGRTARRNSSYIPEHTAGVSNIQGFSARSYIV